MTGPAKSSLTPGLWAVALGLMLVEFLVFDRMTSRHHASFYPRWNDQIQYLTDAYTAYDEMQAHGLFAGLKFALGKNAVQGTLHDTAALFTFGLAGSASRSAALSLNMLAFLAWQAALLFAIPRAGGSRTLGWMAFGLVLCVAHPWSTEAGSAVDFRLDHAAMCLFGVTSCLALLTEGFRRPGWSLVFGLAVGVTILERFLSSVYFAGLFAVAVGWVLCTPDRWRRLRNLALAGAIAAAITAPIFWINRQGILDYYWVGHITGAESAARARGFDLWHSVEFVLGNLGRIHLQAWFGWTAAGLTGGLLVLRSMNRSRPAPEVAADWLFLAASCFLVPAAILTLHRQKSEYVLGILAPGVVLLVAWLWQLIWRRIEFRTHRAGFRLLAVVPALAALASGGTFFALRELTPPPPDFVEGARKINQLSDYIFQKVMAAKLTNPNVSIDRIVDFMDGRTLRVICYERHKTWVNFGVHLPDSILESPDETVMFKLKYSDFVVLTNYMPDHGYWPYDRQMRRLYPELKAWCDGNLELVETFTAFERNMSFYQRREFH
jgi:hypothetical protein